MKKKTSFPILFLAITLLCSCNQKPSTSSSSDKEPNTQIKLKSETVSYELDSVTMNGYLVYDKQIDTKRPAILVVHEWWGLNDYAKKRADQLAELGYVAMAVDMYGNGNIADDPKMAGELAAPFYQDPLMAKAHFDAALSTVKKLDIVDTSSIGGIGYCFGGGVLMNIARLGVNLKGIASFHGNMPQTPIDRDRLKAEILVLHGEADNFIADKDITNFKNEMDSINAVYIFKSYPNATHAFSNPAATATGQKFNMPIEYNAKADSASWSEMTAFFESVFE